MAKAIKRQPWCSYCGAITDLTGDHRIPRSHGGVARTLDDVIVACRSCNSRRGNRGTLAPSHPSGEQPELLVIA